MKIPPSMAEELQAWNNGAGIDLESWTSCLGSFSMAVGYASIFWPDFVVFEDYILRDGFGISGLRGFEEAYPEDPRAIEAVMNHLHISDIHVGCEDLTADKAQVLGETLRSIYTLKLAGEFPDRPCRVEFYQPEDIENLDDYQITFWQEKHEKDTP